MSEMITIEKMNLLLKALKEVKKYEHVSLRWIATDGPNYILWYMSYEAEDDDVYENQEMDFTIPFVAVKSEIILTKYLKYLRGSEKSAGIKRYLKTLRSNLEKAIKEAQALSNAYEATKGTTILKLLRDQEYQVKHLPQKIEEEEQKLAVYEQAIRDWKAIERNGGLDPKEYHDLKKMLRKETKP